MSTAPLVNVDGGTRLRAARRGRLLQYLTIAWNAAECLVALVAGFLAGSIALVGFGFDSAIEIASSMAALWRLRLEADPARREEAERRTLRVIGVCFLLLAGYVAYDAVRTLAGRRAPDHSTLGIVVAALSLIVMPVLVCFKRRVASPWRAVRSKPRPVRRASAPASRRSCSPASASMRGSAGGGLTRQQASQWCLWSPGRGWRPSGAAPAARAGRKTRRAGGHESAGVRAISRGSTQRP